MGRLSPPRSTFMTDRHTEPCQSRFNGPRALSTTHLSFHVCVCFELFLPSQPDNAGGLPSYMTWWAKPSPPRMVSCRVLSAT